MNPGKVARDADARMSEADATAAKVCKSLHDERRFYSDFNTVCLLCLSCCLLLV